jgi:hypothetical protein
MSGNERRKARRTLRLRRRFGELHILSPTLPAWRGPGRKKEEERQREER